MVKFNIIYLTIVSGIAINSLAFAGNSEDFPSERGAIKALEIKPLASPDEKAQGKSLSPDLLKGIGNTEDLLKNGISGSIPASKIEKALKSPDKTFTEDGHIYKILNDHVPIGLLSEMANNGESIRGKIQQTLGPNGIGWQFHYDVPATRNGYDELLWSLHPNFVGATVDFQIEDITPQPSAWYEFWK